MIDLRSELAPLPVHWWWCIRIVLKIACWLLVILLTYQRGKHAYHEFDTHKQPDEQRHRPTNNNGHLQIDFGGQWVMGRMLATGHGQRLYHRQVQWKVVGEGYPYEKEPPLVKQNRFPSSNKDQKYSNEVVWHDKEWMMYWFVGSDSPKWAEAGQAIALPMQSNNPFIVVALSEIGKQQFSPDVMQAITKPAIGGPLYPPVHALLYAPLGMIDDPQTAYRVFQVFTLVLVFVGGFGVSYLSSGRFWASLAIIIFLLYPGFRSGIDLGQNPAVSLCILIWGVALGVRNRPILGGIVLGFLAFKPVWAVTFLLVPLLLRQWKFAFSMCCTGGVLVLLTLPFVGVQSWFDWLNVGSQANKIYNVNETWITLSRDLQGVVRRVMIDFKLPEADRDNRDVTLMAWGLWGFVFFTTVILTLWKSDRRWLGPVGGFALLGMFLSCYRFMYYDVLLSAIGFYVLLADPVAIFNTAILQLRNPAKRASLFLASIPLTFLLLCLFEENWLIAMGFEMTARFEPFAYTTADTAGIAGRHVPVLEVVTNVYYPMDTLLILTLWAILGVEVLLMPRRGVAATPGQYPASA